MVDNNEKYINKKKYLINSMGNTDRLIDFFENKKNKLEEGIFKNKFLDKMAQVGNIVKKFNKKINGNFSDDYFRSCLIRITGFSFSYFVYTNILVFFTVMNVKTPFNLANLDILYLLPIFAYKEVIIALNTVFRYLPIKLVEKVGFNLNKLVSKTHIKSIDSILEKLNKNKTFLSKEIQYYDFVIDGANSLKSSNENNDVINQTKSVNNVDNEYNLAERYFEVISLIDTLDDSVKISKLRQLKKIIDKYNELKDSIANRFYLDYCTYCDLVKLEVEIMTIKNSNLKTRKLTKNN